MYRRHVARKQFRAKLKAHGSWKQTIGRSVQPGIFSRKLTKKAKERREMAASLAELRRTKALETDGVKAEMGEWGDVLSGSGDFFFRGDDIVYEQLDKSAEPGLEPEPELAQSAEARRRGLVAAKAEEAAILAELASLDAQKAEREREKLTLVPAIDQSAPKHKKEKRKYVLSAFFLPESNVCCAVCCGKPSTQAIPTTM